MSKLQHITQENRLLSRLRDLEEHPNFPPFLKSINEYEDIDELLIEASSKANSIIMRLHMRNAQSSRTVKLAQLRIRLTTILINRKDKESNVKQKLSLQFLISQRDNGGSPYNQHI